MTIEGTGNGTQVMEGTKLLYTLKAGDVYCFYKDYIIIANPERIPFVIYSDGSQEDLHPRAM